MIKNVTVLGCVSLVDVIEAVIERFEVIDKVSRAPIGTVYVEEVLMRLPAAQL